jgi:lysozyme family protein
MPTRRQDTGIPTQRAVSAAKAKAAALLADDDVTVDPVAEAERLTAEFAAEFEFRSAEADFRSVHLARTAWTRPKFSDLKDEYTALWAEMAIRQNKLPEINAIVNKIVANKARYVAVQDSTSVPWYVIAAIHSLEASLRFDRHLHNGDPLTAKTVQVPAGRPPGNPPFTWEESAADALAYDGITTNTDWSIERIAYIFENFNGWGYRRYHPEVKSPYLWSYSNHYTSGKYVADGQWSPTAVSQQCGAMVIIRRLDETGTVRVLQSVDTIDLTGDVIGAQQQPPSGNFAAPGFDPWLADRQMDLDAGCEGDVHRSDALAAPSGAAPDMPKAVPVGNPVPFAFSTTPPDKRSWPVNSNNPSRLVVSYETVGGQIRGSGSRRFLASRNGGARFHVGVDLYAIENDEVMACEDGRIVAFYAFYPSSSGEMTYALLVEHANFVINYGEVKQSAPQMYGWQVGNLVTRGQPIARVSSTKMTHFETYQLGTRRNYRWNPGQPRPAALLNPTAYLLELVSG